MYLYLFELEDNLHMISPTENNSYKIMINNSCLLQNENTKVTIQNFVLVADKLIVHSIHIIRNLNVQ